LGKTQLKGMKCSEQPLVMTLTCGFPNLKVRKHLLQNVSIQAICQQTAQQKMWTGVSKHPIMIEALPFHGMQAQKAPCMEGASKF
jgi:hypothetical protein